jgi:intein/homing endonuclease
MTEEHPVFFLRSRDADLQRSRLIHLHQARDLKISDELIFPLLRVTDAKSNWIIERKYKKFHEKSKYKRIRDLNDNFEASFGSRITHLEYIPITAELCRLWGYYLAEASCKNRETYFYFDRDETEYIEDVRNILTGIGMKYTSVVQDKRSRTKKVAVSSAALARAFVRDFGKLAGGKHLPAWIYSLPATFSRELILGWVRGDGNKYYKNGISQGYYVSTISRALAYDFRILLANLGYLVPINENNKVVGNRKTTYRLFLSKRFANKMFGDSDCECPEVKQRYSVYDHFMTTPIVSIEKIPYDGEVHNLATDSQTYMTSAFLVHNCKQVLRTKPHNTKLKARMRR